MRRKDRKSTVTILMLAFLLSILITGCGANKNNEPTTTSEGTTATDSTLTEEVILTEDVTQSSSEKTTTEEPTNTEKPLTTEASTRASVSTEEAAPMHSGVGDAGPSNPDSTASTTQNNSSETTQTTCSNGNHAYAYGEVNCKFCGTPHTHDWKIVVQTNSGVEITPDEDFCCHSGWYFDTYDELRAHMDIPNVHGMVYLNDGSNGVTSVPPGYDGHVDFYACCHGWANCAGDGEGERIEYQITQEVQFCKLCGVRGEATDVGERVITLHTYDD